MIYRYKKTNEITAQEEHEIIEEYGSISQWAWLRQQLNGKVMGNNWNYQDMAGLDRNGMEKIKCQ